MGSGTMLVADHIEQPLEPNARVTPANPVVLIVDDDAALRDSLLRMLAECELTAVGATSSLNALEILQHSHVDVVVSDHFTWGIDGLVCLVKFGNAGLTFNAFYLRHMPRPTSSLMRSIVAASTRYF